jgi:hypothetical protein
LLGLDGRSAQPAHAWEWQRRQPIADITGGFRRSFTYDDSLAAGSSSITRNGLWLQAVVAYEDLLHPKSRAVTPDEFDAPAPAMRVASLVTSQQDETMTAIVTVVDASGAPLPNATVSAAWISMPAQGQPPEEVIVVDECATVAGGSCVLSLSEVAGVPPVRLLITSLEHPDYAFYAGPDVLPEQAVFD